MQKSHRIGHTNMQHRSLVALPVFNEEQHLIQVLNEVRKYASDILVVNDGSTDNSSQILHACETTHAGIQVLTHQENAGYGAALKSAFDFAMHHNYDSLVTIDCDGQHEPALIPKLEAELWSQSACQFDLREPVDIVSGSRYLQTYPHDSTPPEERRCINLEITRQLNQCLNMALTDAFCGFKAYRVAALENLDITEQGYAMPLQLWVQAVALNMQIIEYPVPLIYLEEQRSFGGSLDDGHKRMAYYKKVLKEEFAKQTLLTGC